MKTKLLLCAVLLGLLSGCVVEDGNGPYRYGFYPLGYHHYHHYNHHYRHHHDYDRY